MEDSYVMKHIINKIARMAWMDGFQTATINISEALNLPAPLPMPEEIKIKVENLFLAWWNDRIPTDWWIKQAKQHKTLVKLLLVLIEGEDNTKEFLSVANQNLDIEVPEYKEIVDLYKAIDGKDK